MLRYFGFGVWVLVRCLGVNEDVNREGAQKWPKFNMGKTGHL